MTRVALIVGAAFAGLTALWLFTRARSSVAAAEEETAGV